MFLFIDEDILKPGGRIPFKLVCKSDDMIAIKLRENFKGNSYYVVEEKIRGDDWCYHSNGVS